MTLHKWKILNPKSSHWKIDCLCGRKFKSIAGWFQHEREEEENQKEIDAERTVKA